MNNFNDKKSARSFFKAQRDTLTKEQRTDIDNKICRNILSLEAFKRCDAVLLFSPIKSEPDLTPVATIAFECGKCVAFPISLTDSYTLDFRQINTLAELRDGAYNIKEPPQDSKKANITDKTLCLVPALAFDIKGGRLGYGKGYYDRFLKSFNGTKIGTAHSAQVCDSLPTEKDDVPIDMIITETGVIYIK